MKKFFLEKYVKPLDDRPRACYNGLATAKLTKIKGAFYYDVRDDEKSKQHSNH